MEVLSFGRSLLWVAAVVLGAVFVLSILGAGVRDRRFVLAARRGFYTVFVLVLGSAATLVWGFVAGVYNNEYIWGHSDRHLPFFFRFAGLWAGLEGSLLFWTLLLAGAGALAALQHHWSARHPIGRRLEPYVYSVLSAVLGFFVALTVKQNPFHELEPREIAHVAWAYNLPMDHQGNLLEGRGLNIQLVNYWFVFHPPSLYLGMVTFAVPFAFGIAALITGELGDYWIRVTRRWAMAAWLSLTCGIVLGGLWAYRQLGWGGYWAWDPVENASFLPWCAATAFLHSVMIQERRDMLRWWNVFLLILAFFFTVEATYMTRSGEVASVHAFAGGTEIGVWFRIFKWVVVGAGLFLLFLRFRDLRGAHQLESLLSREAAFFFNNLVLVAIALAVWTLSWLPNLSVWYFGNKQIFQKEDFNVYMMPLLLLLLLLTAVGPSLGWVKTSAQALRRNFVGPLVFAAVLLGISYAVIAWQRPETLSWRTVFVPKPMADALWPEGVTKDAHYAAGLYPTGIALFLAYLIVGTVGSELLRGLKSRIRFRKEDPLTAFLALVTRDNRRYGGYLVHAGIAVLVIGITVSASFQVAKTDEQKIQVRIGEHARIGDYLITPVRANRPWREIDDAERKVRAMTHRVEDFEDGLPYLRDQVLFRVHYSPRADEGGAKAAHAAAAERQRGGGARLAAETLAPDAQLVCELEPERRFYPKQGKWIPEPSIHRRLLGDIYVYYEEREPNDVVHLAAYLNPMMGFIWIGWIVMIIGGVFAILPFSGNRVGLAE